MKPIFRESARKKGIPRQFTIHEWQFQIIANAPPLCQYDFRQIFFFALQDVFLRLRHFLSHFSHFFIINSFFINFSSLLIILAHSSALNNILLSIIFMFKFLQKYQYGACKVFFQKMKLKVRFRGACLRPRTFMLNLIKTYLQAQKTILNFKYQTIKRNLKYSINYQLCFLSV